MGLLNRLKDFFTEKEGEEEEKENNGPTLDNQTNIIPKEKEKEKKILYYKDSETGMWIPANTDPRTAAQIVSALKRGENTVNGEAFNPGNYCLMNQSDANRLNSTES